MPACETIQLDDGRRFVLRRLRPEDLEALQRAFLRLTTEEVEYRFFHRPRELPPSVIAQVRDFDPAREAAFVVDDGGEIRAVADFHAEHADAREAEFGLIVGQAISGQGIGKLLLQRLLDEARRRGITSLVGNVRSDNTRMLELCRSLGASVARAPDDATSLCVRLTP